MPAATASILKKTFGYNTFRPLQREVIENVLARRDSLAVMPTGGGKSLCYQIPALLFEGLTVVVSPLISLMKDQVEQLEAYGVPALYLNSSLTAQEYQANMARVKKGEVKLLYVAPETLMMPRILSLLASVKLDLLTIDEAHCISEWGHDFRPEYRQLVEVRQRFPAAACLALTATATARVREDIRTTLGFATANEFVASFNRPNLSIEVVRKNNPLSQTLQIIEEFKDQSGIIYCFSRRQVDELTAVLSSRGYSALPYHAGLEDRVRQKNQEDFIRDDVQIIVATIAFGMGINKPNVRFVIHYDLPKSIESYYQEIGRAGRDELPARCILLYSYADVAKINYFNEKKEGKEKRNAEQHLTAIVHYAEDEVSCRRKMLLNYFGESDAVDHCANCSNCRNSAVAESDITILAQKFLLTVKRTGERFGAGQIADILTGSKNAKVLRWQHDQLSVYGKGAELSRSQWLHMGRQLAAKGYLRQSEGRPILSLTGSAIEVLKQQQRVMGFIQVEEPKSKGSKQKEELAYNEDLFPLLRQKRKELADAADVPPYVIFPDRTLFEMAAYYPQSPETLLEISGVGQVKMQRYGPAFLQVISAFCMVHNIRPVQRAESPINGRSGSRTRDVSPAAEESIAELGARTLLVGEAYNEGASLEELAEKYQIKTGTVLSHLMRYFYSGKRLRKGEDLSKLVNVTDEQRQVVFSAFSDMGTSALKPVYENLEGVYEYDALKVLRLMYLIAHQEGQVALF